MTVNESEFVRSLRKAGFSVALCESINEIRRVIFEGEEETENIDTGKKYELTGETKDWTGETVYRIRAIKDFDDVKAGDLGGWVGSEYNLSQDGNCWVYDDAIVGGDSWVEVDAKVSGNSWVFGESIISGSAKVGDGSWVYDSAKIYGHAHVDKSKVYGNARVYGFSSVDNRSDVYGDAEVYGFAWVTHGTSVSGDAKVNDGRIECWLIRNRNDAKNFYIDEYDNDPEGYFRRPKLNK